MRSLIKKTIPVAMTVLLTACGGGGGGGGGESDPLAPLTYSGKDLGAKITEDNKDVIAKEVVDFARSLITINNFHSTNGNSVSPGSDIALKWWPDDLAEDYTQCDSGTYTPSYNAVSEGDKIEEKYSAKLNKCALVIAGDNYVFSGTAEYHYLEDYNNDYNHDKDNLNYDIEIKVNDMSFKKKVRIIDEDYNVQGTSVGDYKTRLSTTTLNVYGKSLKYTFNKDEGLKLLKGISGKVYKFDADTYLNSNKYSIAYGTTDNHGDVYLPNFGKVKIYAKYSGRALELCENDNILSGKISMYGTDDDSLQFDIKFDGEKCGQYTVSAIDPT